MQKALVIRLGIIVALIVLLLLPLTMIDGVVHERSGYRHHVEQDIARTWTGGQLLVGPVLFIPYEVKYKERVWDKNLEQYQSVEQTRWHLHHIIPDSLSIEGNVETEYRSRGIYNIPVYTGDLTLGGEFSGAQLDGFRKSVKGFSQWGIPYLSLAIRDVRGIGMTPNLVWNGTTAGFSAGTRMPALPEGLHATVPLPVTSAVTRFAIDLQLRGSQTLQLVPVSKESSTRLQSGWPHPKFNGRYLPTQREVTADGFRASWQVSSFSSNIEQHLANCVAGDCAALSNNSFGVDFFDSVDIYQKITRATKYGILFILLTFVAFFLTETLLNRQLHPVQYVLVGFALCIFYLLLISLSEHLGFAAAYGVATGSCVLLIGVYLTGVLGRARLGFAYAGGISLLYGMLFVILLSEDFALLMGTLLVFVMLAAIMLMTRRVNWYEVAKQPAT